MIVYLFVLNLFNTRAHMELDDTGDISLANGVWIKPTLIIVNGHTSFHLQTAQSIPRYSYKLRNKIRKSVCILSYNLMSEI